MADLLKVVKADPLVVVDLLIKEKEVVMGLHLAGHPQDFSKGLNLMENHLNALNIVLLKEIQMIKTYLYVHQDVNLIYQKMEKNHLQKKMVKVHFQTKAEKVHLQKKMVKVHLQTKAEKDHLLTMMKVVKALLRKIQVGRAEKALHKKVEKEAHQLLIIAKSIFLIFLNWQLCSMKIAFMKLR